MGKAPVEPLIRREDTRSLTAFQRDAEGFIRRLRKSRRPGLLTVNRRAAVVIQDARAYQRILDRLSEIEETQAINKAFRELDEGKGRPFEEFMREFRARLHRRRRSSKRS